MDTLFLATGNPGKRRELQALLGELPVKLTDPDQTAIILQVEETGETYRQNALLKASRFAHASGLWTLADDSGLEVDALGGAPGLHSKRLLRPGSTDAERRHRLLEMLQPHPQPWAARFRCWVALVSPDGQRFTTEGICHGTIIPQERGTNGFGYDPIFLLEAIDKTMAELTMEQKNRLSHRARAVQAMLPKLYELSRD